MEALRDRLLCGIRNESTQKRLLAKADLDLAEAVKIAQSMEAADAHKEEKGRDRASAIAVGDGTIAPNSVVSVHSNVSLTTYTAAPLPVSGTVTVRVKYGVFESNLFAHVCGGRKWLHALGA